MTQIRTECAYNARDVMKVMISKMIIIQKDAENERHHAGDENRVKADAQNGEDKTLGDLLETWESAMHEGGQAGLQKLLGKVGDTRGHGDKQTNQGDTKEHKFFNEHSRT